MTVDGKMVRARYGLQGGREVDPPNDMCTDQRPIRAPIRCHATICPPLSREIQRSRTPDIYFGDSLSTGSPFKIECLYKSSPIRERVLNARTSPLPRRDPSIHRAYPLPPPPSSQQPLSSLPYFTFLPLLSPV